MIEQRDALLRLLRDDDPATLQLVKSQLVRTGVAALAELQALLAAADAVAARHLREVIAGIEAEEADAVFAQTCGSFGEHGDLEDAAWRLAATFLPVTDRFEPQRALLDAWGAEVAHRLHKAPTALDRIETLVEFLGHEVRLRGNRNDYYNLNNSLLPEIIDTRRGIPITLSLVYLLVARRAGIDLHGVGLPGHFIVRHGGDFFDPFHGGRRLGLEDCRALLAPQNVILTAEHLEPATPRQMLVRILGNIRAIARGSDPELAAKVAGWMGTLLSNLD